MGHNSDLTIIGDDYIRKVKQTAPYCFTTVCKPASIEGTVKD